MLCTGDDLECHQSPISGLLISYVGDMLFYSTSVAT